MTQQEPMSEARLDKTLARVRAMIAKAEKLTEDADKLPADDPNVAAYRAEADTARTMADALMLQYAIDDTMIGTARDGSTVQSKPIIISVAVGHPSDVSGYVELMLRALARHCRCRVRMYANWTHDNGWNAKIYGFESDVRYFELLYTTVRLHMLGVLVPRIDRRKTLDENAYILHNAGYNWLEIADMYGWKKYNSMYWGEYGGTTPPAGMKVPFWTEDEGWHPSTYVGGIYKRAYLRACTARGEQPQKIAANGTETYRRSAADGYVGMIQRRLWAMQRSRQAGAELVLASRMDSVDQLFKEDNPDLFPEPVAEEDKDKPVPTKARKVRIPKYRPAPVNQAAYERGSRHAESADLMGHGRAGTGRAGQLGS